MGRLAGRGGTWHSKHPALPCPSDPPSVCLCVCASVRLFDPMCVAGVPVLSALYRKLSGIALALQAAEVEGWRRDYGRCGDATPAPPRPATITSPCTGQ